MNNPLNEEEIKRIDEAMERLSTSAFYAEWDEFRHLVRKELEAAAIHYQSRLKELEEQNTTYDWTLQKLTIERNIIDLENKKLQSKIAELVEALNALVELKNYKDKDGKDAYYERMQPLTWEKACKALTNHK